MRSEITKTFTFEAAHHLPSVGPDHKCHRLHGHLFQVEITVIGDIDPEMGWVMDFGDLDRIGRQVVADLDHRVLNDIPEMGVPTSENIARYLFDRMAIGVPGLAAVTIHESPTSRCTYRPGETNPKPTAGLTVSVGSARDILLSCAHFLLVPPDGREPIHGHDYTLTLTAGIPVNMSQGLEGVLMECGNEATRDMDHRLLVPGRPVIGSLEQGDGFFELALPGERLRLPASDCAVLDIGNTSTEVLAEVVAQRVAKMPAILSAGVERLAVSMTEAGAATAVSRVEVKPPARS